MDYEFVMKTVAARKAFAHQVERVHHSDKAEVWATEHFGPRARTTKCPDDDTSTIFETLYVFDDVGTWGKISSNFYFHDPDQAFAFKMRWK